MKEIVVEELTSPGCHNCAAFLKFWQGIEKDWPNVTFKEISITTPEGQEMAQKYMVMASPGVVINGELFSTGGVNQEEFVNKLNQLSGD